MTATVLHATLVQLENRLKTITKLGGFNTDLGNFVHEPGTYLTQDDAPCVTLHEGMPDEDGVMRVAATKTTDCGQEFQADYIVQAFVVREAGKTLLLTAEEAALDIMRALMGSDRGAIPPAKLHKLTGRGRGLVAKGGNVAPVLVFGSFGYTEGVYQ